MDAPGANGVSSGCTLTPQELVNEIGTNPAAFYVNVHTRDFPAGAVRAQLG
jgi:CHRD domain